VKKTLHNNKAIANQNSEETGQKREKWHNKAIQSAICGEKLD
jgi:hypothetical protein